MTSRPETGNPQSSPAGWNRDRLLALLLVAATFIVYLPAWNGRPIWDDAAHMTRPELRPISGLARIWFELGATQQYYPLVHTFFWLEYKVWGDSLLGYHLVNILLHALGACLLLKVLRRLQVPGAWLAAAIFALHPVQVESVAWISELKNTLSGVFYFGTALACLEFERKRTLATYVLALVLFVLGLTAKTVIATLPVALLVVWWWKYGKLDWRRHVRPLMPFFLVGLVGGLFTATVERNYIGAEGRDFNFSILDRVLIAGRAFWFYLGKLFLPVNLIFIYPRWQINPAIGWQYLFPVAAIALLAGLAVLARRNRAPLAAVLFFACALFPALGFFNVYPFLYSFVADHFQYLACVGIIVLVSAAAARVMARWPLWGGAAAGLLLFVLAVLTWRQARMYRDPETVWRTTLARNPGCFMAHNNLAEILFRQGRLDAAISEWRAAVAINPDTAKAHYNIGNYLLRQGHIDEAVTELQKALELDPGDVTAMNCLGDARLQQKQIDAALALFQKAVATRPDYADSYVHLGGLFLQMGRTDRAIACLQKAAELEPESATYSLLGNALLQQNRLDEAAAQFNQALNLQPNDAVIHHNLGAVLLEQGNARGAAGQFEISLKLGLNSPDAINDLAWLLATCPDARVRNGARALELARQAVQATSGHDPQCLSTLAAALAETGNFSDAASTAQQALQLAAGADPGVIADLRNQLATYQSGKPFRDTAPAN